MPKSVRTNIISWKYLDDAVLKANQGLLANTRRYVSVVQTTEKQKIIDYILQRSSSKIPSN